MARDRDEVYAAFIECLYRLCDGDMKRVQLDEKPPGEVRAFLHRRPKPGELNAALLAILTRIEKNEAKAKRQDGMTKPAGGEP
jgi:hypothetical protein